MEENNQGTTDNAKMWLQDNLRIIISIIIVIAIAGGIYSYSKRSQVSVVSDETTEEQAMTAEELENITEEALETKSTDSQEKIAPVATSRETGGSFIETAGSGDGLTHLARRALANYLEKNPDSELTVAQKIYIEDYLRKNVGFQGGVKIGASVEFSKDLIQEAIGKSKELSEGQIKNLQKYTTQVPSLS